jgi:uncharacterized protein
MNKLLVLFALLGIASCIKNEKSPGKQLVAEQGFYETVMDTSAGYDATFAQKIGADAYGMRPYVLAFLKRGPNRSQDSVTAAQLQKAHLENIGKMAEAGKLVLAGPFTDDGEVRGIYIFNVATVEEARQLTETDPAIQAGRLVMELHPWYGSATLPAIVPLSKRLEKTSLTK